MPLNIIFSSSGSSHASLADVGVYVWLHTIHLNNMNDLSKLINYSLFIISGKTGNVNSEI